MIILEFNQFRPIIIERNQISFESTYLAANKHPPDSSTDLVPPDQYSSKFVNIEFPYDMRRNWFHVFNVVFFLSEQLVSEENLGTVHLKSGRGARRFERRVIKFLTSFLGAFKIYNTCFGGGL